MFKKVNNLIFVVLFLAILFVPFLFTRWESGGVSEKENRNLARFPSLIVDDKFNQSFTKDFENWFMDHMGFRQELISVNTDFMRKVFDRSLSNSDWKTGRTGDFIYAPDFIVYDYAHANLRSEEEVKKIGESYQVISNWLEAKGISFYYVQCVDKHTIYPERFIDSVNQMGDVSKTDQVLNYLREKTTVNAIYFKEILEENKTEYDVFSHWGDATHWTDRGAYISYCYMMDRINKDRAVPLKVLTEEDYNISYATYHSDDGRSEEIEVFSIKTPSAQKADVAVMGQWAADYRHSIWINPDSNNDQRLLLMGDSYFNGYLVDDLAESFREVWMVWGDYTGDFREIVELCAPDVVIYECAERVDRSGGVVALANELESAE